MGKTLKIVYIVAGIVSLIYFHVIGFASRFGLSASFIWIALGIVLILAGLSAYIPLPKALRYIWRGAVVLGIICVMVLEGFVISGMNAVPSDGLDYLIVLGAKVESDASPSPALRRRLTATLKYLENNPDTVVIASGGQGADEPISEAECIKNALVESGIAEERIIMEDKSTTTNENLENCMEIIGADACAGFVTNNYHVFRANLLAKNVGFTNLEPYAATYTGFTLPHFMIREAGCLVIEYFRGNIL